jgi:hypothetical protein
MSFYIKYALYGQLKNNHVRCFLNMNNCQPWNAILQPIYYNLYFINWPNFSLFTFISV